MIIIIIIIASVISSAVTSNFFKVASHQKIGPKLKFESRCLLKLPFRSVLKCSKKCSKTFWISDSESEILFCFCGDAKSWLDQGIKR